MKTAQSRIDDAVNHIHGLGKSELAAHVAATAATGNVARIGAELSLGARADGKDDPQYAANTRTRNALRALLLCQRIYFSELWAQFIGHGGVRNPQNFLTVDWKARSLGHWGNQTEQQINEGILTFSVTTGNVTALADAASSIPDRRAPTPDLTLSRARQPFPGLTSCYGSVMTWLFKSGLASYRWYMKNQGANNEVTLRAAFGPARTIWAANTPFTAADRLPIVPRGHIIHLYVNNPMRWNGHWLVSLGDGTARACNNDTTDGTPNDYADGCSLNNQFLNGYKHALDHDPTRFEPGIAEVIDPMEIPGRM